MKSEARLNSLFEGRSIETVGTLEGADGREDGGGNKSQLIRHLLRVKRLQRSPPGKLTRTTMTNRTKTTRAMSRRESAVGREDMCCWRAESLVADK